MGNLSALKDKILQEIMQEMDDQESLKLAPKSKVSVLAVSDDAEEMNPIEQSMSGEMPEDEEDDEDLKKLIEEYSRS